MNSVPSLEIPGLENPEVIGQGGFGTVYQVDEPEFGRSVAVKVIQERLGGEDVRKAFLRECQAMGALSGHPHIVTVLRGGTTESGRPYIVMDLMSEGSLGDRLDREGPLPWTEVLEIGVMVAGALETAHRAGILHLDLKPANLLVSRYGEPKLADFGISRLPGVTETTDGRVKASVAYAAPERLLDGTATVAADLYGLGATMFTLLTGRPAFTSETDDLLATVARVVRDPVPDLRPRGVPDPVARAIERLMAKSPAERFPSAADTAVVLQAAQRSAGRPVTRAVIEGERPTHGDTITWPARPPAPGVAPLRPLVPGFAAANRGGNTSQSGPTGLVAGPPRGATAHGPGHGHSGPPPGPTWIGGTVANHPPPGPRAPQTRVVSGPPPGVPVWSPPTAQPPKRTNTTLIAAVVAATVVVLGVIGTVIYLDDDGGGASPLGNVPTSIIARPSATVTAPPVSPTSAPVGIPPDDFIAVVSGVTHPATVDARTTLRELYTGINESRYEDAFAYFSPDSETFRGGIEAWELGQSTTIVDSPLIVAVRDTGPDRIEVDVRFTSYQSEEFGPEGQVCTEWELAYDMVGPGPTWLIRGATALAPPVAC